MDRQELIERLEQKRTEQATHIEGDEYEQVKCSYNEYLDAHGQQVLQHMIMQEELCELGQQISKVARGKISPDDISMLEEIVDVQIVIDVYLHKYGIDADTLAWIKDIKLERAMQKQSQETF